MQKNNKNFMFLLKVLIVVFSLGNLILLFRYDYQVPILSGIISWMTASNDSTTNIVIDGSASDGDSTSTEGESGDNNSNDAQEGDISGWTISVPDEALSYDGSGTLKLDEGVVVLDDTGAEQNDAVLFSAIKAGASSTEKVIEYSVQTDGGRRVTAERKLSLSNYDGPSIAILGSIPDVNSEDLESLLTILSDQHLIAADDGYGNDITSAIEVSSWGDEESSQRVITLQVVNMFNDTSYQDITVFIADQISGPVLKLNTHEVTLSVGTTFSFYQYIEYARAEDGTNLSTSIMIDGSVDTSTPGVYVLEFYCKDSQGNTSPRETLTITVE